MKQFLAYLSILLLLSPLPAGAFNASSTNFYLRQNIQSISGGSSTWSFSTSTSFKLLSAGGQTALGTSTSGSSFNLQSGILQNLFKSVKPVYTLEHYHWRLDNGSETTATAAIAEDTATTSVQETVTQRLRIALSNEGGTEESYATQQPRLEYGLKSTTCAAIGGWTDVGAVGGDWDMSNSTNLTNGADTTDIGTGTGGVTNENRTFIADNNAILDTASAPSALSISSDSFMELEYSIQALSAATDGGTYCFRVTDAGTATLYQYDVYPEATIFSANTLPVASAVSIDSGATSVTLNENTTKNVVCAGTVTDNDGFANITNVGAFLYRTSIGTSTASDNNNLYRMYGDSECVPSGGSGSSETYTCTFPVQFYADPTDAGSPYSADNWTCEMHPRDAVATGTPATDTTEMASLLALNVTASIPYGTVNANTDTGSTNQSTTVTNTGNRNMDPEVSGTSMTGAGTISASQQKYLASAFTYSGGGTALSGTPTAVDLDLPQRGASGSGSLTRTHLGTFETASDFGTGAFTTSSFTSEDDSLLVVVLSAVEEEGTGSTPSTDFTTLSGGGLTWTKRTGMHRLNNEVLSIQIWTAPVTTGASMTLSADGDIYDVSSYQLFVYSYTGYNTASPVGATAANYEQPASGAFSITLSGSPAATSEVLAAAYVYTDSTNFTPGTNWTELHEIEGDGGQIVELQSQARTNVPTTEVLWNSVTSSFSGQVVGVALEVKEAGGDGEVSDNLLWGLGVPNGTPNGAYTGTNTFTATTGI